MSGRGTVAERQADTYAAVCALAAEASATHGRDLTILLVPHITRANWGWWQRAGLEVEAAPESVRTWLATLVLRHIVGTLGQDPDLAERMAPDPGYALVSEGEAATFFAWARPRRGWSDSRRRCPVGFIRTGEDGP